MKRYCPPILMLFGMSVFASLAYAQHLTSAKLYFKQMQFEKAEASALKAAEKDPDDAEAWFVLGKARYELKKYPTMIEAFDKAAVLEPEEYKEEIDKYRLKVWADCYNAGIKYYNLGRTDTSSYFQTAIESFRFAILAEPESTRTYYVCALAHYGNKQVVEAIRMLNGGLAKAPNSPDELKLLGQLHLQEAHTKSDAKDSVGSRQEYTEALTAFEKLYDLDRANVENALTLIDLYERLGLGDKSLTLTRDAVNRSPENTTFRYIYGVYFVKQEKYAEGIEQLRRIADVGPDSANVVYSDAVYNLGVAFLNWGVALKKDSDAKEEAAMKVKKKDFKKDMLYQEKFKAAVPYFEKAAQLKEDEPTIWQQLGRLYANLNMKEKADAAFKKFDALNK
jgi:tetratricopeptide (TPR) repeat protein